MFSVQLVDVSTRSYISRYSSHPFALHEDDYRVSIVETLASCTPNIKLSTKNLRCFYTCFQDVMFLNAKYRVQCCDY